MKALLCGLESFEIDNVLDLILDFSSSSRKELQELKNKKQKIIKSIEESYKSIESLKHRLYNLEEFKKILDPQEGLDASILKLLVLEEMNSLKKTIAEKRPSELLDEKMSLTYEIEKLEIKNSLLNFAQADYGDKKNNTR
jgi:predicted RNase H-like nuclease (RuvC/YqgF family)